MQNNTRNQHTMNVEVAMKTLRMNVYGTDIKREECRTTGGRHLRGRQRKWNPGSVILRQSMATMTAEKGGLEKTKATE